MKKAGTDTAPKRERVPQAERRRVTRGKLLDATIEATERQMSDRAILHVYGNIEAYKAMAGSIAKSGLTHHKTEAHVITIALAAYEMNIPVTTALRGMYLVGGKLAMETWLMDLIATRNGVSKTVHESGLTRCTITLHHKDRPDVSGEYTMDDAVRAGIVRSYNPDGSNVQAGNAVWRKHPEEMIYWRCLSKLLRRIAPDLFGGVYTTDESDAFDKRKAETGTKTDTNAELAALSGVEPDPDAMDMDEIDTMAREFSAGVQDGLVTPMEEQIANNLAIDGKWSEAREMWDELRSKRLRGEDAA